MNSRIVARGDFASSVSEEYYHPYTAKLCGALSIYKEIDHILLKYPYLSMAFAIKIGSNCQSVIYSLWNTSSVITLNTYLYQIVREISIIRDKLLAKIVAVKIVVYQDRIKSRD